MIGSLRNLFSFPYNKTHPFFAIVRFIEWKFIRLFKLKDYKKDLWQSRSIYLNYDSFQSMWIMYNYIVDWEEFNLISDYVKNGDVVADIGANMGFYTIWMSKFIGEKGSIHSFEPDSKNFQRLNQNIAINKLNEHVLANEVAVSDSAGTISFTKNLDGENHISKLGVENTKVITSVSLDDYFQEKKLSRISYMKIDIEGFEYMALMGASGLLKNRSIDIIQIEINKAMVHSGIGVEKLLQLLEQYDYTLCRYDVKGKKLVEMGYNDLRENYFAVHDIEKINQKLKIA